MSPTRIFSIILLGLSLALGPPKEPNRFSIMTVTEAEQLIEQSPTGPQIREFIYGALESERLDLAKVAWIRLGNWLRNDISEMPDSRFKEDVLLMMLQTDCGYWPDTITYGSRGIISTTEPFTPLIQKYLPDVKPSVSLLESRQARLRLVAQIEHARGAEAAARREQERQKEAQPPPSTSPATPNPSAVAAAQAGPTTALATKDTKESGLWLWASAAFLALIAVAVLVFKRFSASGSRPRSPH